MKDTKRRKGNILGNHALLIISEIHSIMYKPQPFSI
jgi:hypothetical protein